MCLPIGPRSNFHDEMIMRPRPFLGTRPAVYPRSTLPRRSMQAGLGPTVIGGPRFGTRGYRRVGGMGYPMGGMGMGGMGMGMGGLGLGMGLGGGLGGMGYGGGLGGYGGGYGDCGGMGMGGGFGDMGGGMGGMGGNC
ncbi:hypothetical protein O988_09249 [Pseudogymnoascus sp. VKM F-3808]|nr:hypothetical protein O988_09249 [Pseudogymnoascus sp. VKM F-3808]KFY57021.1 hypothetical protein V497_05789 [Pseudogymnoascus sp. VKM F-4516 (FW-969)]